MLVPVAGGLAAAGQDVLGSVSRQTFDGLPDTAGQWLLVAAAVIALAWLLSIAGAVVTFAGFEVVRDGDRLRTRSGLFARRAATLPLSRVQGVRVVEGLLREPFGLATLRVETAGYAGQGAVTQTLFPLVRRRDAAAVIDRLVPALAGSFDHLEPAPGRARRSYLAGPLLLAVAVCRPRSRSPAATLARGPPRAVVLAAALGSCASARRAGGWTRGASCCARVTSPAPRSSPAPGACRSTARARRRCSGAGAWPTSPSPSARADARGCATSRPRPPGRLLGLLRPS